VRLDEFRILMLRMFCLDLFHKSRDWFRNEWVHSSHVQEIGVR
jgi:hypothetical protein